MKKIGVIGIVLKAGRERVEKVQSLLSDYGEIIVGRMGIPDKATGINTISLIVNGDTEKIESDESWKTIVSDVVSADFFDGEIIDAGRRKAMKQSGNAVKAEFSVPLQNYERRNLLCSTILLL